MFIFAPQKVKDARYSMAAVSLVVARAILSLFLLEWTAFSVLNEMKKKGLLSFMAESLFAPTLSL
jgi:hypothetical protein